METWERPHFVEGGDDAFLYYVVFGDLQPCAEVSASKYRTRGFSTGTEAAHYTREKHPDVFEGFLTGYLWEQCKSKQPMLAALIEQSNSCVIFRGEFPDPHVLDYLRDAVGILAAMLDQGGVAVFDAQMFTWWSSEEWRERIFVPAGPVPRHHVLILVSPEDDPALSWYHTRGLRKFGRPDLSVHNVTPELEEGVIDMINRFIEFQAFGGVIDESREIILASLPPGGFAKLGGHLDDPDFNNVHVEISWKA